MMLIIRKKAGLVHRRAIRRALVTPLISPVASRRDSSSQDAYAWMEEPIQKVLDHLQKENRYTYEAMKSTHQLQKKLFNEMYHYSKSGDRSFVALPEHGGDGYIYYSRREPGYSFPTYYRRSEKDRNKQGGGREGAAGKGAKEGKEEVILDQNALPDYYQRLHLEDMKVSPCHKLVSFTLASADVMAKGSTLYVRQLDTGRWWTTECWKDGIKGFEWGPSLKEEQEQVLYYTRLDHLSRPSQAWISHLATRAGEAGGGLARQPQLILDVKDADIFVSLNQTKDRRFVTISCNNKTSSEVYLVPGPTAVGEETRISNKPHDASSTLLRLFRARQPGIQCFVDHGGDRFFIVTNTVMEEQKEACEGRAEVAAVAEYSIMTCPTHDPSEWIPLIEDDDAVEGATTADKEGQRAPLVTSIDDIDLFENHVVLYKRFDGIPGFSVVDRRGPYPTNKNGLAYRSHRAQFTSTIESGGRLQPGLNQAYQSQVLRFSLSSPIIPDITYDYDMAHRRLTEVHREILPARPTLKSSASPRYRCDRIMVEAHTTADSKEEQNHHSVAIPMTLAYRQDLITPGQQGGDHHHPVLLQAYGAYGVSIDLGYRPEILPLLDRGWIIAFAHVRGGGELGRKWHAMGRGQYKVNSLTDYLLCANWLFKQGWTRPKLLVGHGSSAGALLVASAVNRKPDLFGAMILKVPFLDLVRSMTDPTLPLTVHEYDEWGVPSQPGVLDRLRSLSPYETLHKAAAKDGSSSFPHTLVLASLADDKVQYWQAAKYVARARELFSSSSSSLNPENTRQILLRIEQDTGHEGPLSHTEIMQEAAFEAAFMHTRLGLREEENEQDFPVTNESKRRRRQRKRTDGRSSNRYLRDVPPLSFWT